ncbi:DNA cytosine methyltransferase [Kitasatospora sp. NPDC058170]|uniref:DNA cytosine methyltransferase n=1 Tax=Kitasatospora sp. NPDC058170 TaxID=3346364 RepID=UPI0036DD7B84
MSALKVVEICAGAGGQALGLENAGFEHVLAVELDPNACATLKANRPEWAVAQGDVADEGVWRPEDFKDGLDLLAGGVPCPPFTIAGKQLGAADERDLFAWAVGLAGRMQPKALLLENVRGLSASRFSAYRQHVLDTLLELGYIGEWRLLQASDFGVPQLRPRFVLVALKEEYAGYFHWPEPDDSPAPTVGEALKDLMAANGWEGAEEWAARADAIAPTIVGGSKKHGGADLGPSRAKAAWAGLGVDAWGVANEAPGPGWKPDVTAKGEKPGPKLTTQMAARIQGFSDNWKFQGRKTTTYRQIGNAFPPPVAEAVGRSIARALKKEGAPRALPDAVHDPVYAILREASAAVTVDQILAKLEKRDAAMALPDVERHLSYLIRDFDIEFIERKPGVLAYKLHGFKAFVGQDGHERHELFKANKAKIS